MKDGGGFSVRGSFDLDGTIVPNGPGKWKLSGQFSVSESDFAVGVPIASAMGSFGGSTGMNTDTALFLIDIPVRPPAANAAAGTARHSVPFSLDIAAPAKAQFSVTLTQM